jgi:uncharacterized protein (UPF0332 family)
MKKPDWKEWIEKKEECGKWLKSYLKRGVLRRSSKRSQLYLKKSLHNLNFANWIFENSEMLKKELNDSFYDWIINIYYYAIYHAGISLMEKEGYNSKNHSATLCFLIYHHYHCEKELDVEEINLIASSLEKEEIETLGFSKELREKACYDVGEFFERPFAENIKEQAVSFVSKIRGILNE